MGDISGPILADTGSVTACVDASDSATLVCADDGGMDPLTPTDLLGAGWELFVRDDFQPTTVNRSSVARKVRRNWFDINRW